MPEDVFGIVGTVIAGVYHVESVAAEGGFGVVYRARHGGLGAPVAVKVLRVPALDAAQRRALLDVLRAETELLFRFSARSRVAVRPLHVDVLEISDGRVVPYIVMEWLEGLTLKALIQRRVAAGQPPVPLRKLVRLLTPVVRALQPAGPDHEPAGEISVAHRDLRPEKLFIAQRPGEEVVKLLGLWMGKVRTAASQGAGSTSQDPSRATAFTHAYGAPEQWAPREFGPAGPWTDVWGLALCIVETLAARPIIAGDSHAMRRTALDAARRPTPREAGVEVSDAVEAVFARALALDPRARYNEVGAFWDDLAAALEAPVTARLPSQAREDRPGEERAPRIELVELPLRLPAASPRKEASDAALERVLAADLEFDPTSPPRSPAALPGTGEGSAAAALPPAPGFRSDLHFVPDLELAPPSVSRKPSGADPIECAPAQPPTVLDLDDASTGRGRSLDLDLPVDEPISIRALSSSRARGVPVAEAHSSPAPPRAQPGSTVAARESRPPISSASALSRSSGPVPPTSGSRPPHAGTAFQLDLRQYEARPLSRRLRPSFALLGLAMLLAVLDPIYAGATGQILKVLGSRLSLFGGALLLLALALAGREALRAPDS